MEVRNGISSHKTPVFFFFFGKFKYWYRENSPTFSFSGTVSAPLRGIFVYIYAAVTVFKLKFGEWRVSENYRERNIFPWKCKMLLPFRKKKRKEKGVLKFPYLTKDRSSISLNKTLVLNPNIHTWQISPAGYKYFAEKIPYVPFLDSFEILEK